MLRSTLLLRAAQLACAAAGKAPGTCAAGCRVQLTAGLAHLRSFAASGGGDGAAAALAGCRALLSPTPQQGFAAALTMAGATASRQSSAAAASGRWAAFTAVARRQQQQQRCYSRFLQFQQPQQRSRRSWAAPLMDPDRVLWGLIGTNLAGFLLWQTHPYFVSSPLCRAQRVHTACI